MLIFLITSFTRPSFEVPLLLIKSISGEEHHHRVTTVLNNAA